MGVSEFDGEADTIVRRKGREGWEGGRERGREGGREGGDVPVETARSIRAEG